MYTRAIKCFHYDIDFSSSKLIHNFRYHCLTKKAETFSSGILLLYMHTMPYFIHFIKIIRFFIQRALRKTGIRRARNESKT